MLKVREFIKKIRQCKTSEEERSLINKETAEIRNLNKTNAEAFKVRSLSKCIFITLLGYHTEFIHMTCLTLLADSSFTNKRLAYTAMCILMDENSELLLLASHTIKKDLEHKNHFIIGAALNAISEVCSESMCLDCTPIIIKCLSHNNPYIRKKASLALCKVLMKCPDLIESIAEHLDKVINDTDHGVLLCGLTLAITIFKIDESYIHKSKKHIEGFIKLLKTLSNTNYSDRYDVSGIVDPFLQIKLIETLSYFSSVYKDESLDNLLASLSTNTDSSKTIGCAIVYEVVRTIISIKGDESLNSLAGNILSKFIISKENNYKYIALNSFRDVAKIDINSVKKHQSIILQCLKDEDNSIKRRSLNLVYMIIDEHNIELIVKECLNFLLVCDNEFKIELTSQLTQSLNKYAHDLKYEINTLIKMLCLAGNYITNETLFHVINVIIHSKELYLYSMFKLLFAMKSNLGQDGLIKVGVYCLGELIDCVFGKSIVIEDEKVSFNEEEVIGLFDELYERKRSFDLKKIIVNCLFKFIQKEEIVGEGIVKYAKKKLESEAMSFNYEIQERANEYLVFCNVANGDIKNKVKERVPVNVGFGKERINKRIIINKENDDYDEEEKAFDNLIQSNNTNNTNTSLNLIETTNTTNTFDMNSNNNTNQTLSLLNVNEDNNEPKEKEFIKNTLILFD